jgi:hypothetical protein
MLFQEALLAVVVQVMLTFALLVWMGRVRIAAVRRGETRIGDIALGQPNWPPRVQQISNCYHNQYQLPVLFYVLVALALILRKADLLFVVMAWLFVASRLVHAAIHTTSNDIRQRFAAFGVGFAILFLMWVIFAARVFLAL